VSLPYAAQASEHRQIEVDGSLLSVLLGGDTTAGQVSVIRARAPAGFATTVHVHSREDEMYVLLEGGGIFWAGQNKYQLSPGGVALLPRNVTHALRITAASDILAICTPAGIERFFEAIGPGPVSTQARRMGCPITRDHGSGRGRVRPAPARAAPCRARSHACRLPQSRGLSLNPPMSSLESLVSPGWRPVSATQAVHLLGAAPATAESA
jgi:mannose-6-phosphate isomerase-like protein (cupin superfamily)